MASLKLVFKPNLKKIYNYKNNIWEKKYDINSSV